MLRLCCALFSQFSLTQRALTTTSPPAHRRPPALSDTGACGQCEWMNAIVTVVRFIRTRLKHIHPSCRGGAVDIRSSWRRRRSQCRHHQSLQQSGYKQASSGALLYKMALQGRLFLRPLLLLLLLMALLPAGASGDPALAQQRQHRHVQRQQQQQRRGLQQQQKQPCAKQPSKGECGPQCQEETREALTHIRQLLKSPEPVSCACCVVCAPRGEMPPRPVAAAFESSHRCDRHHTQHHTKTHNNTTPHTHGNARSSPRSTALVWMAMVSRRPPIAATRAPCGAAASTAGPARGALTGGRWAGFWGLG